MDAAGFLSAIWPAEGPYVLATPRREGGYSHHTLDTIREAAQRAAVLSSKTDVFFGIMALKEHRVWNPDKVDPKTGDRGAWAVRTQANMRATRAFILDLDVGEQKDRYPTQHAAVAALKAFVQATGLPKPCLVSSGGGIHVYWLIEESVPADAWLPMAVQLKRLAAHHGLRADPSRTSDRSSVLRVVGTYNWKTGEARLVKALHWAPAQPLSAWAARLQAALIRAGLDATMPPAPTSAPPSDPDDLGSNLTPVYDGPAPTVQVLGKACGQIRLFGKSRGNVSEPFWYAALQVLRHVEDGRAWAHKLSAGHPNYTPAETDARLDRLEQDNIGPTTCARLADVGDANICSLCRYRDRIKSPIVGARNNDLAPTPVLEPVQPDDAPQLLVDAPLPFKRTRGKGVLVIVANEDGDVQEDTVYEHDFYPVARIDDVVRGTQTQVWRAELPHGDTREFAVDAQTLYRADALAARLGENAVYLRPGNIKRMQEYMSAYIARLQAHTQATQSYNTLGWHSNHQHFVMPGKRIDRSGKVIRCQLTPHAESSSRAVVKAGTLAKQVELLRFYAHPGYAPQQLMVLGALAAPLFHMTGHHGVVVNATGKPGASKSTSLYTGASLWAHPQKYPLNGTNHGATQKARVQRMVTMGSLPVAVDEITTMSHKDAQELVMSVTQPEGRLGLNRDGQERRQDDGEKSTIMLCTANSSLHSLLSYENVAGTAGSMRVIEIRMEPGMIHQKHEADTYLMALRENHGHIGEAFMDYVLTHYDDVASRVRAKVKAIDAAAQIQSAERFWSAALGVMLVAGELAWELQLLRFDTAHLESWILRSLIPSMRGTVATEYTSGLNVLADYLEEISGSIAVTKAAGTGVFIIRAPNARLLAHLDMDLQILAVLRTGFKDYCTSIGANLSSLLEELNQVTPGAPLGHERVIPVVDQRRILAAGTDFAKMRSRCFLVDMRHPEVSGAVNLSLVEGQAADPPRRVRG